MSSSQRATSHAARAGGLISVDEALELMLARVRVLEETESVPLTEALGRVMAGAETSPIDVPGYANSSMDGYAVRAADATGDARVSLRVAQRIAAGEIGVTLAAGEAARIFTGAALPEGADAVVIQEPSNSARRVSDPITKPIPSLITEEKRKKEIVCRIDPKDNVGRIC